MHPQYIKPFCTRGARLAESLRSRCATWAGSELPSRPVRRPVRRSFMRRLDVHSRDKDGFHDGALMLRKVKKCLNYCSIGMKEHKYRFIRLNLLNNFMIFNKLSVSNANINCGYDPNACESKAEQGAIYHKVMHIRFECIIDLSTTEF